MPKHMQRNFQLLLLFMALTLPQLSFALDTGWKSSPQDQSIYFLGLIFGPVGNVLYGSGKQILGQLFSIFNIAILSIGTLVVAYTVITSSISTAQEGEVMGKKFSSIWIPIRTVSGVAFLLPTSGGYSILQILIMSIILQGIHAGNKIYSVLLDSAKTGISLNAVKDVESPGDADKTLGALGVFESLVCMEYINNNDALKKVLGDNNVSIYIQDDLLYFGVEADPKYDKICGILAPAPAPDDVATPYTANYEAMKRIWRDTQLSAGQAAVSQMQLYAEEAVTIAPNYTQASGKGVVASGRNAIKSVVANTPSGKNVSAAFSYLLDQGKEDGWIFAGSYYFKLIAPIADQATSFPPPISIPFDEQAAFTQYDWNMIKTIILKYLQVTDIGNGEPRTAMDQGASAVLQDSTLELFKPISDFMVETVTNFVENTLTSTEGGSDPIVSMATVGSEIMVSVEITWYVLMGTAFLIALGLCPMSGTSPLCYVILAAVSATSVLFTAILFLFWGAGVLLGIYIPMIPYILFTFTAISWLILTLEAMVAAPLVALGLVSPAQDHLGRASPAVILLANIFLRPSLMVLGFVAGSRLVIAVIKMLHFGFSSTIESSLSYLGIFGGVALLVMYSGVIIMSVHESFSLIYVIPDKVIRWIGGQAEQSIAAQAEKEVRGYSDKGAKVSKDIMKGSVAVSASAAKQKMSDDKGGGGGGSGGISF